MREALWGAVRTVNAQGSWLSRYPYTWVESRRATKTAPFDNSSQTAAYSGQVAG